MTKFDDSLKEILEDYGNRDALYSEGNRNEVVAEIKKLVVELIDGSGYTAYGGHESIDIAQEKKLLTPGMAYQAGHIDGQRDAIEEIRSKLGVE